MWLPRQHMPLGDVLTEDLAAMSCAVTGCVGYVHVTQKMSGGEGG